jgi:predicted transcriptional regulator
MDPELSRRIRLLWRAGNSAPEISRKLKIAKSTVFRHLKIMNLKSNPPRVDRQKAHRKSMRTLGEPCLAWVRSWKWRELAMEQGFPGARSRAELETLKILQTQLSGTVEELGKLRNRSFNSQARILRILYARGLIHLKRINRHNFWCLESKKGKGDL